MKDGRDAVADRLRGRCRSTRRRSESRRPGRGIIWCSEGIAVQIDNARQRQQAAGIDAGRALCGRCREPTASDLGGRRSAGEVSIDFLAEQGPATFDVQFSHDAALWLNG